SVQAVSRVAGPPMMAPELMRIACARYADNSAIEFGGRSMSYGELLASADRLSAALIRNGAKRNRPVALLTYRGSEAVVGILGAMGAGAPWVPLDPDAPIARLRQQLDLAGVDVVVHERRTEEAAARIRSAHPHPLAVVSATDLPDGSPDGFAPVPVEPDDIAYVIFTSGSTGVPKGVPITHGSFGTYLQWATELYPIGESDRSVD